MCGFAGLFDPIHFQGKASEMLVRQMGDAITHRGPDSGDVWRCDQGPYAVAHRRLAIIDLTDDGRQPMTSHNQRYVLAYNGEMYNFPEIRSELERHHGVRWRGGSDTEVLLEAIVAWGIDGALSRAAGMFALALWDKQEQTLILARDRVGKKPVYFGWLPGGGLMFASEIKSMWEHPDLDREIDRDVLAQYMRYACVPQSQSIYKNVYKLPAGCHMKFDVPRASTVPSAAEVNSWAHRYWSMDELALTGASDPFRGSDQEAIDELEVHLEEAVRCRMISDVPLGAFLSGGVDSSIVVALMQKISSERVKTFSIGYDNGQYNEAQYAKEVAAHIGTDHTEFIVTSSDAQAVIPQLPRLYDEPFADVSQIPTFLVSKLARQQVTVALSGDGGDEVFGGYNRHIVGPKIWTRMRKVPRPVRWAMAQAIGLLSPATWDRLYGALPGNARYALFGDKLQKIAKLLPARNAAEVYDSTCSLWHDPATVVIGAGKEPDLICPAGLNDPNVFMQWMKLRDVQTYLADDILVKVDRATMATSLEARAPLLDHRLIEWAWRLPAHLNVRGGQGKWVLRELLYRHVPKQLIDRPKMGFDMPIVDWLRTDLRDWAESLISEGRLRREGYFVPGVIRAAWQQHLKGKSNLQNELWAVLMFQAWLEEQS